MVGWGGHFCQLDPVHQTCYMVDQLDQLDYIRMVRWDFPSQADPAVN